ncbi:MAG: hypothetical protein CMI55_01285 [Parcubacteria group bacterium]|nr:hypothetical protein [Parcubacteria group bacterium]
MTNRVINDFNNRFRVVRQRKVVNHKNIQFWPFLCADSGSNRLILSWYQYSSATSPEQSDIYISRMENHEEWKDPCRISGGISYNNAPCVIKLEDGRIAVYWHSWRSPGVCPFEGAGGMTYIWGALSKGKSLDQWFDPFLVFPDEEKQLYPSICRTFSGDFYLVYSKGYGEALGAAHSLDGINWVRVKDINGYKSINRPDIAIDKDGTIQVVFSAVEDKRRKVFLVKSEDAINWEGQELNLDVEEDLDRPKISIDSSGYYWIALQTDHWQPQTFSNTVELSDNRAIFRIESDKTAGNYNWTINAIQMENLESGSQENYRFCRNEIAGIKGYVSVTPDCIYSRDKGFGLSRSVVSMKRMMGDEITSSFIYGDKPCEFIVNIQPGTYKTTITISPWLSGKMGTHISVNGTGIIQGTKMESYIIVGSLAPKARKWEFSKMDNGMDLERTRPSRIIDWRDNRRLMTWCYFSELEQGLALGDIATV